MLYELHWLPVQEQITFFSLKKLNYNNSVSLDVYYTSSKPRFQIWSLVFQSFVHLYRAKILKSDHTFPRNENIQKEFGPNKETVNNSHLFILFLTTIKLIISLLSILECPFPSPPPPLPVVVYCPTPSEISLSSQLLQPSNEKERKWKLKFYKEILSIKYVKIIG